MIKVNSLRKKFKDFEAVKGISFETKEGRCLGCWVKMAQAKQPH